MADRKVLDGYVRVSRVGGREGDSYISPSVQREAIQRWADYKGITIAAWHIDEDWSGGTHQRPGLETAVARALAGETGGIVSWKIDRFSRQTEGGMRDLRRLQDAGARLAFVVEDIDTETVYGKMIYTILLAVSEAFLENVKAGWVVAKERAVKRGAYISRTPFGYRREDNATLSPHPEQAPVVTGAYRLAASYSLRAATEYLQQAAPNRRWTTSTVRRLLGNRVYLGTTSYGDYRQELTHEPLVSRSVWEAAQIAPQAQAPNGHYLLSGLARCGTCGEPMSGGGRVGKRCYRCTTTHTPQRGTCASGASILVDKLDGYVREETRKLLTGLHATVGGPETDKLTLLERAVTEAEAELDAFAGDLTMRRSLGDRYHAHLEARVDAVEQARSRYRSAARQSEAQLLMTGPEIVDDPDLFPIVLRSIFAEIVVLPGRGLSAEQRVRFVPLDVDGAARVQGA